MSVKSTSIQPNSGLDPTHVQVCLFVEVRYLTYLLYIVRVQN